MQTKIQQDFIAKKKQNKDTTRNCIQKLLLNKLKVMGNSTFIYTYQAPSSKKFFNKLPTHMWPMFTHV
jgi:hypothetical protein